MYVYIYIYPKVSAQKETNFCSDRVEIHLKTLSRDWSNKFIMEYIYSFSCS